jgi:hypothetical protein
MDRLRKVEMDGFVLETWDTSRTDEMGKSVLRYELRDPSDGVVFAGADFSCSPLHAIASDESLRSLLGFLTLRPGDTDADYFRNYTERQLKFCRENAETLSIWADEDGPEFSDRDPQADECRHAIGTCEVCTPSHQEEKHMTTLYPFQEEVGSKYGSPMGRTSADPYQMKGKLHLRRVPAVDGDYDEGGAYWGSVGGSRDGAVAPLWCAWGEVEGELLVSYVRAKDRESAKAMFPYATFYRFI